MSKDPQYRSLLGCVRWRRLRLLKLSRQPLCERCEEQGRIRPATEVHHRVPVEQGRNYAEKQALAYDLNNLCPLCHDCHIAVHREQGRSGRKQRQTVTQAHLQRFRSKFMA